MFTFDVFDTLITRTTATPTGIFALMQLRLMQDEAYAELPAYIKRNFYHLRIQAEKLTRHCYGTQEIEDVTIEQIYEAMATTGSLSSDEIKCLLELERATEYENIIGIRENIEKVKRLVAEGERVAFISDMYLDHATIQKMLIKVESSFQHIPLYVSSTYKKGKYTKNLYTLVKELENADFHEWVHCGDNLHSDVEMAKKLGIQANHFPFEPLLDCEKKVLAQKTKDAFIQLTIGTARNVRLEHRLTDAAAIGASLGGVILFPYVWWLLQESLRKGIHRLYFIARDGYVLKEIADVIIAEYQYEIKTDYIYGSRRAWRMASFSERNNDVYKFVQWSHPTKIKNIRGLANVFQISVEDFIRFLPLNYQDETIQLTKYSLQLLTKQLNQNEVFKYYLIAVHKEKRAQVVAYLQQGIPVAKDDFAFVELSGGGFTQGCLAEIMRDFYDKPIQTFYYKMDHMHVMDNCICYNFMPSLLYLTLIIEMFCRAPHGQTFGYKEEHGRMVPILKDDEGLAIVKHGFYEYTAGVKQFTKRYAKLLKTGYIEADQLELVSDYMDYITKIPDEKTLSFFGSMPNSESGREKEVIEFAPRLSKQMIRDLFLLHPYEAREKYYKGSSLEYSLLRCSEAEQKRIHLYQKNRKDILARFARLTKTKLEEDEHFADGFPCELLERNIVLYAAGKFGRALHKKIQVSGKSKVVQWVDQNYAAYQIENLEIVSPDKIGQIDYDQLVIAVLDKEVANQIRAALVKQGIADEKIVWIDIRVNWF